MTFEIKQEQKKQKKKQRIPLQVIPSPE